MNIQPAAAAAPRWLATVSTTCTALAAAALVTLSACATRGDDGLSAQPPLAAGWQESSRPLLYEGPGISAGTTAWRVPATLPRGNYFVIERDGDRARVVQGHRFEVDGTPFKDIKLIMPLGQTNLEVLDVKYLASAGTLQPAR